jgi:DsbC/DsbD-like thiol-disulfide interchange protein
MRDAILPMRPLFRWTGILLIAAALLIAVAGGGVLAGQGKEESLVKVTAKASKIDQDGWQLITLKMEVDKDWHAYANPVQHPDFEPDKTLVKVTSAKKLEDVIVDFPKGTREVNGKYTYFVYKDSVEILAKVKRAAGDSGPLEVTVKYVLCSDKEPKVCLPQKAVVLQVK